jgi:hypothetical protein
MLIGIRTLAVVATAASLQLVATVSGGFAADVSLTTRHRGYARIAAADYDATPVYIRRIGPNLEELRPAVNIYHPMMPPNPRHYHRNGQPIK